MVRPYINPLGFIDRITQDGATFTLTKPGDYAKLCGRRTPVTVWRYSPEHLAIAKVRGHVTAVGYSAARFTVSEYPSRPQVAGRSEPPANQSAGIPGHAGILRARPQPDAFPRGG